MELQYPLDLGTNYISQGMKYILCNGPSYLIKKDLMILNICYQKLQIPSLSRKSISNCISVLNLFILWSSRTLHSKTISSSLELNIRVIVYTISFLGVNLV